MVCTLFGQKGCQNVQQSSGTRLVFSGQSLKHFNVISMVDKSTDHGKLL